MLVTVTPAFAATGLTLLVDVQAELRGPVCPARPCLRVAAFPARVAVEATEVHAPACYLIRRWRGAGDFCRSPRLVLLPYVIQPALWIWGQTPRPAVPGPSAVECLFLDCKVLELVCSAESLKTKISGENTPQ